MHRPIKPGRDTTVPNLSDWNWHVLMLGQALLGVISTNFRMVTLEFAEDAGL